MYLDPLIKHPQINANEGSTYEMRIAADISEET
jgi:hypothetical protein